MHCVLLVEVHIEVPRVSVFSHIDTSQRFGFYNALIRKPLLFQLAQLIPQAWLLSLKKIKRDRVLIVGVKHQLLLPHLASTDLRIV